MRGEGADAEVVVDRPAVAAEPDAAADECPGRVGGAADRAGQSTGGVAGLASAAPGRNVITTRRPTATAVPGPASSTIPAASWPSSIGVGRTRLPSTTDRSEWHSPAASIRTSSSPDPGGPSSSGPTVIGRDFANGAGAPQRSSTAPVICTATSSSSGTTTAYRPTGM
ncbi:hypothetical protein GCM10029992_48890 [Glycomyces albus]